MEMKTYIGKEKWNFSDDIYYDLTGNKVNSNFNPEIPVLIKELPGLLDKKKLFGIFWSTPTFKDTDCNYLFHVYDKKDMDYIICTSSANTVEGLARVIPSFNEVTKKDINAILLVPEMSAYKVDKHFIENNQYIKYVVLKNSDLDSIRVFASELKNVMVEKYSLIVADANLKTAAYAQMGLFLKEQNLFNEDVCFVQTVSGGVGPAGVIEAAYKLNEKPEFLVVQPLDGTSTPIIDALKEHSQGKDPFSLFNKVKYETPKIETTLGSSKPFYALEKFVKWREKGNRIVGTYVNIENLQEYRDTILSVLVKSEIYPNKDVGLKLYDLEKSGFIAFIGTILSERKIKANNVVINFTGRCFNPNNPIPESAEPYIFYDPAKGATQLLKRMKL